MEATRERVADGPIDWAEAEQLALEAQRGDGEACERLLRLVRPRVVRYLQHRTGRRHLAEDLAQDTLLRVFRKLHQYNSRWRLSTWVFSIARNIAVRADPHRRGRRRERRWRERDWAIAEPPESRVIDREDRRRLWRHIRQLVDAHDYTGLRLVYAEGLTLREAGRLLRRSPEAMKSRMLRVRRKLRQAWDSIPSAWDELPRWSQCARPTEARWKK